MPYLFTPPTRQVPVASTSRFWSRTTDTVGRTILKQGDKQYVLVDDPSNEAISGAVLTYLGGHTYYISDLEAADLTEAGYASFIAPVAVATPDTYGSGAYGTGTYGQGGTAPVPPADPVRVYGAGTYGTGTYDGRG